MKKKACTGLILTGLFQVACQSSQAFQNQSTYSIQNDTVYLHAAETLIGKIRVEGPERESIAREVITAGAVQAIPTRFAHIVPPFAGRVTRCHVRMGQKVCAHAPLFEIVSPEFTALQKEYFQTQSEWELARKDLERKEELTRNGVCSGREYEEAQHAFRQAEKEYENIRAILSVYQVDPDKMRLGAPLVVRTPIAGEVLGNQIVAGSYVGIETDPLVVVGDLEQVWVAAQVDEKDIRFIAKGDEVTISLEAWPGEEFKGRVVHIEEAVDEENRSIRVFSACDNPGERFKLGMYATTCFYGVAADYTVVSESALMQDNEKDYILTQITPACFVRKTVEVDFMRDGKAYISKGLLGDDRVICEGADHLR